MLEQSEQHSCVALLKLVSWLHRGRPAVPGGVWAAWALSQLPASAVVALRFWAESTVAALPESRTRMSRLAYRVQVVSMIFVR